MICEGWTTLGHEVDEKTGMFRVRFDPCRACGGNDCGDFGETYVLCEKCFTELLSTHDAIYIGEMTYIEVRHKRSTDFSAELIT